MKFRKDIESLFDRIQDRVPDSADDVLEALGLQRRRSAASIILPAVGTLVVGAAIGSALGMIFGPRYGYRLMDRLGVKLPESLKEGEAKSATSTGASTTTTSGVTPTPSNNTVTSPLRIRSDVHS